MFSKVLVANRGAIACRIIRTLRNMDIRSVAVYSEADRHSLHVQQADEALAIGPPPAAQSYLSMGAILEAARKSGAEAIHPGYGFLSENADFAQVCADSGVVFIGPTPEQMRVFGLKHTARAMARECGVPLLPGTGLLAGADEAVEAAVEIGYPVMLKSTAGGGGIGMRLCRSPEELVESFEAVEALSLASFGNSELFIEKFVTSARHIEVQIFGDGKGTVISLGERDCSPQRRNQKVIEETPAPGLRQSLREKMFAAAIRLGEAVGYQSAGTVEFIYDNKTEDFYFLEVNTRLQVEHGVTEEVTGVDLVEWMVQQAAGELSALSQAQIRPAGCSIQARVYAENPAKNFQPSSGRLTHVTWPERARVETWVEAGTEVTPFYDPMLAKILVRGDTRAAALVHLRCALKHCAIAGIETNLSYLRQVTADPAFEAGGITTSFLEAIEYRRSAIDVIEPGTQTTVQDYPGRAGYWHVGVPPSGPMDALAFRIANRLVGNLNSVAGLEIAVTGPTLRFASETVIALTGADFGARLDGVRVPLWRSISIPAGSTLEMTTAQGAGSRAYLAVSGGLDVPEYLESRSTFILGGFGGHAGRVLRAGDVVAIAEDGPAFCCEKNAPSGLIPQYAKEWEIGVLYGPHGAPDFFTPGDIEMFFSTAWKVHHHSDRTGIRLIGPKPEWARPDGGEAGLHPSNIHDNAYAVGTVDFTGDMPVILGLDGPSLGGFVCPATIVQAELWKMGQLKPGDLVRFRAISKTQAAEMEERIEACIAELAGDLPHLPESAVREEPVLSRREASGQGSPAIVCRADGDRHLLIEYGPNVLDLTLRARVHALEEGLRASLLPGILDITAGVRSLQVHYDGRVLGREHLLEALTECEEQIPDLDNLVLPSRIVHLPLSWDDPATRLAIAKYMQSVRPDAPWCPSNIEFIRRINGLDSIDEVHRIVFDASYLVLGLGDVYLGAPVATPIDPRHRLVTTKYNPARTWTPENAVGIGGAYLCVYGMEGPGGYQFVGRTLQMWNTYRTTEAFQPGTPWLLRSFDQIRFFPVSADELTEIRDAFPHGKYSLRMEDQQFRLKEYHEFLGTIAESAADFKRRQQEAFLAERERWALAGADQFAESPDAPDFTEDSEAALPDGCRAVRSPTTASVWRVAVEPGQRVIAGEKLIVLEAMKMEIAVAAPMAGVIEVLNCVKGGMVLAGTESGDASTGDRPVKLTIGTLRTLYNSGQARPSDVIAEVYERIGRETQPVWISLIPRETALARARDVENDSAAVTLPLYGIPFAVKDNIDAAGVPTTAGCPAYSYVPERSATVVERLLAAGAILVGKTNLDQFATGLVGTRSPHGACSSVFDARYISGGSSSGSAVAVASELVSFSLGTDTAGSGRIPAAFNNLVGLKPSRGLLSAAGVVPACRSLDCVSIFAANSSDAQVVWDVAKGSDPKDPYSRVPGPGDGAAPWAGGNFRFGVPAPNQLEFFGDQEAAGLFKTAVAHLEQLGGTRVEIDFSIFRAVAELLYSGPWVAERLAAIHTFFEAHSAEMNPVVAGIIGGARRYSAVDAFEAEYRLRALRKDCEREWQRIDVLVVPSAPTIYTHEEIAADPVKLNTNLGYYTNFVNLLDQAAVATPGGFRSDGLPFGITFIGPAFTDEALLGLADRYHRSHSDVAGPAVKLGPCPPGCIAVAVVGAHLSGQPLNWQLTQRRARLLKTAKTPPGYRLYALPGTQPPKPGLVREEGFRGPGIEVEIWAMPENEFGSFVAAVPAPLGIGNATLEDGNTVKCFICEPYALENATEITHFGGWRAFLASHSLQASV